MVSLMLMWMMVSSPEMVGGVYCDEVMVELMEYRRETGNITLKDIDRLMRNCEGWEERYEAMVEAGEVEPIESDK